MRVVLVLALLVVSCTFRAPLEPTAPRSPAESWRDVPQATSRTGIAHICPYLPHLAYTSRHVVLEFAPGRLRFIPLTWQQRAASGSLYPLWTDARRDLAVGCSDRAFPRVFERAEKAPEVGSKLTVAAHRWDRKGGPREEVELVVADLVGGMIRLEAPQRLPASSGACLTDEDGRLVGVFDWSAGMQTGYAAAVWGEWGEIPEEWRDAESYGWVGAEKAAKGCAAEARR